MARAPHRAEDSGLSKVVLDLLGNVAALDGRRDVRLGAGDLACCGEHLVVGVADHDGVADDLGGAAGELAHVIGVQVTAEEGLSPHGKLAAFEHKLEKRLLEVARRDVTRHEHHVAGRPAVLLVQLAGDVDEHDAVAVVTRALAKEVGHGPQAHDALRAHVPLRGDDEVPLEKVLVVDVVARDGQLVQDGPQPHVPLLAMLCSCTNIVTSPPALFGARSMGAGWAGP